MMTIHSLSAQAGRIVRCPRVLKVRKGQRVLFEGRAAMVLAVCSPLEVLLRVDGTIDTAWATAAQLSAFVVGAEPDQSTRTFTPRADDTELARASEWVRQLTKRVSGNELSPEGRAEIAEAMHCSERTVARHLDLYRADPSPYGQLPCKPGPELGQRLLTAAIEAIIDKAINEKYLTEQRGTIQSTVSNARLLAHEAGLPLPSYKAVSVRIQSLDRWKAARKRHGRVRGDALAGPAGPSFVGLKSLDFVQMDHAIVDVILVDEETRKEIGRPWITLAIDVASRCVLGFYLTFDPPSQTSVALAMEHACCPKEAWLAEIGCEVPWLPFGLMKVIGWDNAKCFKPTSLVGECRRNGIDPLYRAVRNPTHGAHIERYIGTYMGKIHLLKGTTFSNTKERGDYPSQKSAVMTLPELIRWTVYSVCAYHNTPHAGLEKQTPLEVWQKERTRNGAYEMPPYPADRRSFRLSLLPGALRKVSRSGISRFHQLYWDEALTPLIGSRHRYWVAHDPRDVSQVYLRIADDRYLNVPWRDRTRPPIALWELQKAKKTLKSQHVPYSEERVFECVSKQREIESQAEATTRASRRGQARRPKAAVLPIQLPPAANIDYSQGSVLMPDPLRVWP